MAESLSVTTDVRRDLLASAGAFKTDATVVWEYVVNGLEYVTPGVRPSVLVTVKPRARTITISDNGRGMNQEDLKYFFRMHGENRDRRAGRPGRGKFGTGKSAAFGIASTLQVDSSRDGRRNVVLLTRDMIDRSSGDDIPLSWVTRDEPTDQASGTIITIGDIHLAKLNAANITEYIERHLRAFRGANPQVAVNEHLCEYREPAVADVLEFTPPPALAGMLGDITLHVRVSRSPLSESDAGVVVTAGIGNLVAIERGGVTQKEWGNYLLGEVDVPALERHNSPLQPYDSSRSLMLNPEHPVAQALIAFVGASLEQVRKGLVTRDRDRRRSELERNLREQGEVIADLLNQDFTTIRHRLDDIRAATKSQGAIPSDAPGGASGSSEFDDFVKGKELPGEVAEQPRVNPTGEAVPGGRPDPRVPRPGKFDEDGGGFVDPSGGDGARPRPRGGFKVLHDHLGAEEQRSRYDAQRLAIIINLDHPVVSAAFSKADTQDIGFSRLCYEIAFAEYAMALGYEMARRDPEIPADDLLFEVRSSLNRVSTLAAALYRDGG